MGNKSSKVLHYYIEDATIKTVLLDYFYTGKDTFKIDFPRVMSDYIQTNSLTIEQFNDMIDKFNKSTYCVDKPISLKNDFPQMSTLIEFLFYKKEDKVERNKIRDYFVNMLNTDDYFYNNKKYIGNLDFIYKIDVIKFSFLFLVKFKTEVNMTRYLFYKFLNIIFPNVYENKFLECKKNIKELIQRRTETIVNKLQSEKDNIDDFYLHNKIVSKLDKELKLTTFSEVLEESFNDPDNSFTILVNEKNNLGTNSLEEYFNKVRENTITLFILD